MQAHIKSYIKDIIYGANDGIVTTFAVIAGVAGASLAHTTILIVGFASLFADGFSMAASNYLGTKSECDVLEVQGIECEPGRQVKSALYTFFAFILAGLVPLLPYLFSYSNPSVFRYSVIATALVLFGVGAMRAVLTRRSFLYSGLERLLVGGVAATIAYYVGLLIKGFVS